MDFQGWVNLFALAVGGLGGWILNNLRSEQIQQRKDHIELTDKVHKIDVLVAGTYVKREDMTKLGDAIFHKLDRIESKLDSKADK